ncbi:stage V sporulation protein S [Desulfitobacterium hafniense DP7]|nr:stage V sporulation protein S [Desulfitobacterium hafniense DP7]
MNFDDRKKYLKKSESSQKKEDFFHLLENTLSVLGISVSDSNRRLSFMDVLKVSAKSSPNSVAGALAGVLRERGGAELQAIGAGALNQAVKAVAIARGFVAPSGVDLVCIPAFTDIQIDGEERTAIKLIVEPR